jgi:hypothetical protein
MDENESDDNKRKGSDRRKKDRRKSKEVAISENVPSELDEVSIREISLIYEDATRTLLFAKGIQWKAVASCLILFLGLLVLVKIGPNTEIYVKTIKLAVLFTTFAAISMVLMFQFWQHTESQKINSIAINFSSAFRTIRAKKSNLEANMHRYIILFIMNACIIVFTYITIVSIDSIVQPAVSNQFEYKP